MIDYFNTIVDDVSTIPGVRYVHRSRGTKGSRGYASSWTQAVPDVEAGSRQSGESPPFGSPPSGLGIAPFSIPITTDTFKLWIEQPEFR